MSSALLTLISIVLIHGSSDLCEKSDISTNSSPIIEDLYANPFDSLIYIKANCPCFCSIEENTLYVFQTKRDGDITQAWRFEGVTDLSMPKKNEIISINKLPPDDNGNQNFNTLKTQYVISGNRISSKDGDAIVLPKTAIEKWRPPIIDFSMKQHAERAHKQAIALFKQRDFRSAIALLLPLEAELETSHKNDILNDLGFFLEQANRSLEAIPILEKVIAFDPSRTPAYLNLADAYAKAGDKAKAKANYLKYVELMDNTGKGSKVPSRVRDLLKN